MEKAILQQKMFDLINQSETMVFYCEYAPEWPVLYLTDNFSTFGYSPKQFYQSEVSYQDILHPEDAQQLQSDVALVAAQLDEDHLSRVIRLRKQNGDYAWIDVRLTLERNQDGQVTHLLGKIFDVTERIQSEERIKMFARVIEQTADLVKVTDKAGRLVFVNQALCEKTGYREEELLGRTPSILKSEMQDRAKSVALWETILNGQVYHNRIMNRCKDGSTYYEETTISPIFNAAGEIEFFVSTGKDVSDQVIMQQALSDMAMRDTLTGLCNRRHLNGVLNDEIKRINRYGGRIGLIMLDVDHFKYINDTFGHDIGDDTLIRIGNCLCDVIRETDHLARWGGEEFLILAHELDSALTLRLAEKIRGAIESLDVPKIGQVTISAGATVYHKNEPLESFTKRADEALYLAKQHGRNRVEVF